jgi:predicted PurR-regulated permease PerM
MSSLTVIVMAVLVSAVDHVVRPRLVAGRVGLSNFAMFFALLGGVTSFGVLGVVLGPVAFATCAAIVDTLKQPAPEARPA